ncbi:MAG: hypothetical protein R3C11_17815 [Planctomycetaceae bacterium]
MSGSEPSDYDIALGPRKASRWFRKPLDPEMLIQGADRSWKLEHPLAQSQLEIEFSKIVVQPVGLSVQLPDIVCDVSLYAETNSPNHYGLARHSCQWSP